MAKATPAIQMLSKTKKEYDRMVREGIIPRSNYSRKALIKWIFWKRLETIIKMLEGRNGAVLDFGTGYGVLLPSLSLIFERVYGTDIDDVPLEGASKLCHRLGVKDIQLFRNEAPLTHYFERRSIDTIIAADVLEHIPEPVLSSTLQDFLALLAEGGQLIVSAPIETLIYRLAQIVIGHRPEQSRHMLTYCQLEAILERNFRDTFTKNLIFFKVVKLEPRKDERYLSIG